MFFCLIPYIPVNSFSVVSGRASLGITSTKQKIKCLAEGHDTEPPPQPFDLDLGVQYCNAIRYNTIYCDRLVLSLY